MEECEDEECDCCCWWHGDPEDMMFYAYHAARSELLKEKIKKALEEAEGKKMDDIAKTFVDAKLDFLKAKNEMYNKKEEMLEKLWEGFEKD